MTRSGFEMMWCEENRTGGSQESEAPASAASAAAGVEPQSAAALGWASAWLVAAAAAAALLAGCRQETPLTFEPNLVHATKYRIGQGLPMDQTVDDASWVVREMFGTPDEPKIPAFDMLTEMEGPDYAEDLRSIVSLERLEQASGPADADGRGLYRKHCALCHGVSGDGRGATSAVLVPYPRDYRKGVFKFKSTPRGSKPVREDISKLIRNGIVGTAMNKIPELTDEDVEALTDYVIYLSWRGELERTLIDNAAFELDLEQGDRLIDPSFRGGTEEEQERFEEDWLYAEEDAASIAEAWLDAEDEVVEVPDPPADIPVVDSYEEFLEIREGDRAGELESSITRGQELFVGKIASCSKCHGEKGRGDGQTTDYDDWTKEWTTAIGIKPDDREALIPLLARGALPPINANPRNFEQGVFHGGATAEDLYLRITQGVDGSPMPAATFVEGKFEQQDVWHLINFVRSLRTAPLEEFPGQTAPTGEATAQ